MHKCLFLNELPKHYKKTHSIFSRGTTTIIIEPIDNKYNKLLMFTRDYIKFEYLKTKDYTTHVDSYFSNTHPHPLLRDSLIHTIEIPKFQKISIKEHNAIFKNIKNIIELYKVPVHDRLSRILDIIDEDHVLYEYFQHVSNFDNWHFDIKRDSVLIDHNNNYHPIDLVIPTKLLNIIHNEQFD